MGRHQRGKRGNKDEEFYSRNSPRTCVRKIKRCRVEEVGPNRSEPKRTRKRRAVNYEDDPSFSEGEDVDAVNENQKKVPGYRCSSHLIPELMKQLCPKQLAWVEKIGFGALKKMIGSRSPKSLTMWLVDQVDTTKGTIDVCGQPVDIRKAVKRILNLPSGGKKVPQPLNGRAKAKIPKAGTSRQDEKHSDHGRGQTAKEAMKVVLAEKEDEVAFCQSFVMLVLCIYLAPTTSLNINRSYFPALMDVSQISLLDWCGFIGDYLISGIEESRKSKASHVQVPGCVHLLPLVYIDALVKQKALALPEALKLPVGEPRIHFIGSEHLAFLASADMKSKSKDRIEYGLLQGSFFGPKQGCQDSKSCGPSVSDDQNFANSESSLGAKTNASELLESLFREIKDGREKLVQEFHRQIVETEEKTFRRFRLNFLKGLALSERSTHGDQASGKHMEEAGGYPDGQICKHLSQEDKDNNHEEIVEEAALAGQGEDISCSEAANPMISRERTSEGEKVSKNQTGGPLGETEASMKQRTTERAEVLEQHSSPLWEEDGLESAGQGMNIVKPPDSDVRNMLTNEKFYDELAEVAVIGRQAAEEARWNDANGSGQNNDGIKLSILSEAAETEGPPRFDASPAVDAPKFKKIEKSGPSDSVSTSDNVELCEDLNQMKRPIYDKSPVTPTLLRTMQSKKLQTLITIPEICRQSKEEETAKFPASLLRAAAETDVSEVNHGGEVCELAVHSSNSDRNSMEDASEEGSTSQNGESSSGESDRSESAEDAESTDVATAEDDEANYADDPLQTTPGFLLTPSYTYDTQEPIEVPDSPANPTPDDIKHIPELEKELDFGLRFRFGCSVSSSTGKLFENFNHMGTREPGLEDPGKFKFVLCKNASETYKMHVSNSSARLSSRLKKVPNANRDKTKIQIKRFHVTKGEFVDAMKPNGEVCQDLMGLCSAAILTDWESPTRIILDQDIIRELMREGHVCDTNKVVARLRKCKTLEQIEEIFLPVLTSNHWILVVVNVLIGKIFMYDSLFVGQDGENPHQKMWDNLGFNLEHAFSTARVRTVTISHFGVEYPKIKQQTNLHDCGLHVIQTMECYNSKDIVGHSEKKTMMPYRKYLTHVLVYHRFNDLNPLREGIVAEAP